MVTKDWQYLSLLFHTLGNKLALPEKREKLLKEPKEVWMKKEQKKWQRFVRINVGSNFDFKNILKLVVLVLIIVLVAVFGFPHFMYQYKLDIVFHVVYVIIGVYVLSTIVSRYQWNRQVKFAQDLNSTIEIEDGKIHMQNTSSQFYGELNQIEYMVDTEYGFFLVFNGTNLSIICEKRLDNYAEIHNEVRSYVSDDKYIRMEL